jgi:putative membrane protein insertion efficiency factor
MGHRNTPAQLGGHSEIFDAGGRFAETSAAPRGDARNARALEAKNPGHERPGSLGARAWALLAFVRVYQMFLSPFLGGACKFYPSCSNYAAEAIRRHGAGRGFVLAMKRLGRCRPFTQGGYDPVPDEGKRNASPRSEEPVN